jgi:hypothetical protein
MTMFPPTSSVAPCTSLTEVTPFNRAPVIVAEVLFRLVAMTMGSILKTICWSEPATSSEQSSMFHTFQALAGCVVMYENRNRHSTVPAGATASSILSSWYVSLGCGEFTVWVAIFTPFSSRNRMRRRKECVSFPADPPKALALHHMDAVVVVPGSIGMSW